MDFWQRLIGGSYAPKKPATHSNDPQARLARFQRAFATVQQLCDRPRDLAHETVTLEELQKLLEKLTQLIREESRAPAPHLCLQFSAANQIYALVTRAAVVSHHEGLIHSTVTLLATLVDSDEEDFLSSQPFAKSLMRLVTRVVDSGNLLLGIDTETAILELLFTIAAKIRLQPSILPVWFAASPKQAIDHGSISEKKDFVGSTRHEDFPLCYLLIGRVHHEGRIGDFARTGLLYIFEATGRSVELEEWIVQSDLPTLMASGLGALYSQLSRELSILHPDATLPAVLAMSDYSTTHHRASAESAFSERHQAHIATFLSYLAFWQDILDHCRSADVKQTLLDHFQILFLQQLLYPSILQSSDTDAGSSIAVLTYVATTLEALEYPDMIHQILTYLLAITDAPTPADLAVAKAKRRPSMPPRSPTAVKRRQSLMLMTAPKDPEDVMEPALFNLVDLMHNSLRSNNAQTVYAALSLTSVLVNRQKKYAFETLLKVRSPETQSLGRTIGSLELDIEQYSELSLSLHDLGIDEAYAGLADDVRLSVETQASMQDVRTTNMYALPKEDHLMRLLSALLRTFFTNSIDVNLALTQALASIALCIEVRLDAWFASDASQDKPTDVSAPKRAWQSFLEEDAQDALSSLHQASTQPTWSADRALIIFAILQALANELEPVRASIPNLDQLITGRKNMLQAASIDAHIDPHSIPGSPMPSHLDVSSVAVRQTSRGHSRSSSTSSSVARGRNATNSSLSASARASAAPSPNPAPAQLDGVASSSQHQRSVFQPPPPESPSTTDVLMQSITFPNVGEESVGGIDLGGLGMGIGGERKASLNHVLTNVVVLQEFVLELVAVLQVRAAVLGEREVRFTA